MKNRILVVLVLIVGLPALLMADGYDSLRARGMGGAYTALADDSNALFLNPAGLAYLKRGELRASIAGGFTMTRQLAFGEPAYPYVYQSYENYEDYVYWDDFYGNEVYFDPADYGFPWGEEGSGLPTYQEAVDAYIEFQTKYEIFESIMNVADIGGLPRVLYVNRYWGVANISNISLNLVPGYFDNLNPDNVPVDVEVVRDGGLMAGLGIPLGPISVGANARFFSRSTSATAYDLSEFEYGPPEGFMESLFVGAEGAETQARFELGVGALFASGPLNAGIYVDNLLAFLYADDFDLGTVLDTANVGVAFTPANQKTSDNRSPLNLSLAADFRNMGSETDRVFAVGAEAGLDLANIIVWNFRLGYRQGMPGSLTEMLSGINLRNGIFTTGIQSKFLFFDIQWAAEFPADVIFNPPYYPLPVEQARDPFATMAFEVSVIF